MTLAKTARTIRRNSLAALGTILIGALFSQAADAQVKRVVPAWAIADPNTGYDRTTGLPQFVFDKATMIQMALIPAGTFIMGASPGDVEAFPDEKPARPITILRPFYMGRTEVTQFQWAQIMGGDDPGPPDVALRPVSVPFQYVRAFCARTGSRLASEAEWEWACRGGTQTPRYHPRLHEIAQYTLEQPVAQLRQNAFGLFDMLGNVLEWTGSALTPDRIVVKGGGVGHDQRTMRASWHDSLPADVSAGFRIVRDP